MEDELHERISQLAHELWEKDGKPDGKDAEHWQAAKKIVESGAEVNDAEMTRTDTSISVDGSPDDATSLQMTASGRPD